MKPEQEWMKEMAWFMVTVIGVVLAIWGIVAMVLIFMGLLAPV